MKKFKLSNRGFSLIEIAIALAIIGVIISLSIKGKDLLELAKLRATVEQANAIKIAVELYKETHDETFDTNQLEESKLFFQELQKYYKLSMPFSDGVPVAKIGGHFYVSSNIPQHSGKWLVLAKSYQNGKFTGLLTPAQAKNIDKSFDTGNPSTGEIRTITEQGATESIIDGDSYNLKNSNAQCILLFAL